MKNWTYPWSGSRCDADPDHDWLSDVSFEGYPIPNDRRIFVSSEPVTHVRATADACRIGPKPTGLWYSCGSAWIDWLQSEMPHWADEVNYIYEIDVVPDDFLALRSEEDVLKFTQKYGRAEELSLPWAHGIDWPTVAKHYTGIEICPYIYTLRLDSRTLWYYGWDVASGCVWHPDGVSNIQLIWQR